MGASVAEDPVTNDLTNDLSVGSSRRCETFRKRTLLLLVFLCILISFSLGVTTVVVPFFVADRFARLYHGYSVSPNCSTYAAAAKPSACTAGEADALSAAAAAAVVTHLIGLAAGPALGSISDRTGRRAPILACLAAVVAPAAALVFVQSRPGVDPLWFYVASALGMGSPWISLVLASTADAVPSSRERAASFGAIIAGIFAGYSVAPSILLVSTLFGASCISLAVAAFAFLFTYFVVPETLPDSTAAAAARATAAAAVGGFGRVPSALFRPFKDISVLFRTPVLLRLSVIAFFSAATTSGDMTFSVYYFVDTLNFTEHDIVIYFGAMGLLSILALLALLPPLLGAFGARDVLTFGLLGGCIQNAMYALAARGRRWRVFLALFMEVMHSMAYPLISFLKSSNVTAQEQGITQGALFSVKSLAGATGPALFRAVNAAVGPREPGSMFLVGTAFLAVAAGISRGLPERPSRESSVEEGGYEELLTPSRRGRGEVQQAL
eukprot:CAMPEP_0194310992 /NCGR_PEP_ID=MMETSP0171-20130528/7963_1 /TAXON_ID=218684 /ORGANISM="Corethron pennatum, Strain L29A3" /LENGTH=495 /DNA_ID=CAMNT_0039064885 /DNA_START=163 /DNA_END=1650 /DNA_ORIENTATION=-